jgi:fructosamine-3-kinase
MNFPPQQIKELVAALIGKNHLAANSSPDLISIGGGSINDTYRVKYNNEQYFLKLNDAAALPGLFAKEKNGLQLLAAQGIFRIPAVIDSTEAGPVQVLLLEWIDSGPKSGTFWSSFGEQLAHLHTVSNQQFGLYEDNFMGALPQVNSYHSAWSDFFIRCRLQPQIQLAAGNKLIDSQAIAAFERLYSKVPGIFSPEQPALLHGDLWSGNYLCDANHRPVLVDPAVYFGHRSMDLAMTTLFGGFEKPFYEAYDYHYPLPGNYADQWEICNLYPLLIHLNLFGRSYLSDVLATLKRFT